MDQIRIVIADDQEIVRTGLKTLLNQNSDMRIVGEASTGDAAILQATLLRPGIVVMDIRMPGISGVDACRKIVETLPDTRVIMLTTYAEDELLFAAIRAGAAGYVLKRIGTTTLLETVQAVARGEAVLDPVITSAIFRRISKSDPNKSDLAPEPRSAQELRY